MNVSQLVKTGLCRMFIWKGNSMASNQKIPHGCSCLNQIYSNEAAFYHIRKIIGYNIFLFKGKLTVLEYIIVLNTQYWKVRNHWKINKILKFRGTNNIIQIFISLNFSYQSNYPIKRSQYSLHEIKILP